MIQFSNLSKTSVAAFGFFVVGKLTSLPAALAVLQRHESAPMLLGAYASLIGVSILLAGYDGLRNKQAKEMSKREVELLAIKHGLI